MVARKGPGAMKAALFTAAVGGDNAGDALIESAITRLAGLDDVARLPLASALTEEHIAAANDADVAIICGTNLYQSRLMSGLTSKVVEAIRVPLIPIGIGTSAPIGELPRMDDEGIAAVRAIHRRCRMGSVRDLASLRFLKSIGVENVALTGCPVLFHGLRCPDFRRSGEGITLAPRTRLLHSPAQWQPRQSEMLDGLARRYRPRLVLQSPYDLAEAQQLSERYELEMVWDDTWQAERYIEAARRQQLSVGFRLHFAMLSIAYGKPAFLVSHDSRGDEFAKLIGLSPLTIDRTSDALLRLKIDAVDFPADRVRRRWTELAMSMERFLGDNGLASRLEIDGGALRPLRQKPLRRKPRIGVLVDKPDWAYDHSMRQLKRALARDFRIDIAYRQDRKRLDPERYDLLHVCFWGEEAHKSLAFPPERIVKEVSSHRWQHASDWGPLTADELSSRWLADCETVICTSERLKELVEPSTRACTFLTPNGIDAGAFRRQPRQATTGGPLAVGWAGDPADPAKQFSEIVVPACRDRPLKAATGGIGHARMAEFYAGIDVYLVTSAHEGEPLTLIEAMAAGCFPVCSDVGVVPELIRHGENGLIVREATADGFRQALAWCDANAALMRAAGQANAQTMARERDWSVSALYFARAYREALARVLAPRFRNDDVAWDSSLVSLDRLSGVFRKYGQRQIHGVCLNGRNNAASTFGGDAVEYAGRLPLSKLPNDEIKRLSEGYRLADRTDLVNWLERRDDEVALHGLYHTDYSAMSAAEQDRDIDEGMRIMRRLFPSKRIRYFIAPFNRTNADTYRVARRHGLEVLAAEGVHLEEAVHRDNLVIEPMQWYRYHHHRFYAESTFKAFDLSIEKLDHALGQCFSTQPRALALEPSPRRRLTAIEWRAARSQLKRIRWLVRLKRSVSAAIGAARSPGQGVAS